MLVLISLGRCKKCVERLFDIFVTEDVRSVIDVPVLEVESIIFVSDLVMSDVDATIYVTVELMVSNFKIAFGDFSSANFTNYFVSVDTLKCAPCKSCVSCTVW